MRHHSAPARTAALVALATLALAACSGAGEPGPSGDPVASASATQSAAPAVPVGLEWTELPAPSTTNPEEQYRDLVAGGAYWLVSNDLETTLHVTRDGQTWDAIDLTAHGMPADASFNIGNTGCGYGFKADDRGDAVTFVYYTYTQGSHPAGLAVQMWLANVAGDDVTVTPGASVGLEDLPPQEGEDTFRPHCAGGFVDLAGERVMVGEGQWWHSYSTSSMNAFTATQGADGRWALYSTKASPFLGGDVAVRLAGVEVVDDTLVAVLHQSWEAPGFTVWISPDARAWEQVPLEFPAGADVVVDGVAATDAGVAVLTHLDEGTAGTAVVWHSADGRTWTSSELGGGDYFNEGVVVAVPGGYLASAEYTVGESSEIVAWVSEDGVTWVPLESDEELRLALLSARALGDGLVAQLANGALHVSGTPWG